MSSNVVFILQTGNWQLEWQSDLAKATLMGNGGADIFGLSKVWALEQFKK